MNSLSLIASLNLFTPECILSCTLERYFYFLVKRIEVSNCFVVCTIMGLHTVPSSNPVFKSVLQPMYLCT